MFKLQARGGSGFLHQRAPASSRSLVWFATISRIARSFADRQQQLDNAPGQVAPILLKLATRLAPQVLRQTHAPRRATSPGRLQPSRLRQFSTLRSSTLTAPRERRPVLLGTFHFTHHR